MESSISKTLLSRNQDLFRSSVEQIPIEAVRRADQWLKGAGPYPPPVSIHFNLTLRCTARCLQCLQWAWPSLPELDLEQVTRLISIFHDWGVRSLTLAGGNPLLHKRTIPILEAADQAGISTGIVTEGLFMPEDLVCAIATRAAWIRFSLDGPSPDVHDDIRSAPGLFDTVIGSIRRLRARNRSFRIGLNCVVQRRNFRHLSEMISLARQVGVSTVLFKIAHGDDPTGRFLLTSEEWSQFTDWVRDESNDESSLQTNLYELRELVAAVVTPDDTVRGRPVRTFYTRHAIRCFVPLFFLTCDSEANAYPCDYLQADTRPWAGRYGTMREQFRLGNILQNPEWVLARLADLMKARIHGLPASGYDECGTCTRFCQLNAALTDRDLRLYPDSPTPEELHSNLEKVIGSDIDIPFL